MRRLLVSGVLAVALTSSALTADVLIVSTSFYDNANAIASVLTSGGHTVTIVSDTGGSINIPANTQVVFVQGYLYSTAADQIANWLSARGGRGLVTTEWIVWYGYSYSALDSLLPVSTDRSFAWLRTLPTTYAQETADPVMNNGLPASFLFDGYGGLTRFTAAKPGATVFYSESYFGGAGVAGWQLGNGSRVVSINAVAQDGYALNSVEFRQLLVNAVTWAAGGRPPCRLEGDVNGDGVVNDADLLIVLFNFGRSCP